jgi:hypothetical protein
VECPLPRKRDVFKEKAVMCSGKAWRNIKPELIKETYWSKIIRSIRSPMMPNYFAETCICF